jgi:thiamine biosynthesis lipoprotein
MNIAFDSLGEVCLHRRWQGFGTTVDLRLWPRAGSVATGAARLSQSTYFLHRAERRLSRFCPDSELSRLNQRAGTPVRVSTLLMRLIADAIEAARATDGLFDPTVHRALLAAGYTTTFKRLATASVDEPVSPALPGRYREVCLDRTRRTVLLPYGTGLDLGGIAKGWLAGAVLRRLRPLGAAAVDIGGDCAFTRPDPNGPPWTVAVDDPWIEGRVLDELLVPRGGGVATSGIVRRQWRTRRGWQHHLIDPRSGRPAETDLASVTVVGPNAIAAEVLAKVVLLMGLDQGAALLSRGRRFSGLLVPFDGPPVTVHLQCGPPTSSSERAL